MNKHILKDKLKQINNNELSNNIYNILCNDINFKYTKNNNGILFNLSILTEETINNILNIIKAPKFNKIEYNSYFEENDNNDKCHDRNMNIKTLKIIKKI